MMTKNSPVIALQMTDKDVIERAAHILGVPIHNYTYKPKGKDSYKPVYTCRVHGKDAIGWMMTLFTFMGDRRRTRIKEIIAQWKSSSYNRAKRGTRNNATCHPDRVATGFGLCKNCYMKEWRKQKSARAA